MQGKDQCFTCGKDFNKSRNLPKLLSCDHVICNECAVRLYQVKQAITCPWCKNDTNIEPLDLELAFTPGDQQSKTKECKRHKGQEKILFCQEDQETLCLVCANFGEQHKGHTIKDIINVIDLFQRNEFKQANEQKEIVVELLGKYEQSLQEEKSKASENLEKYIVAITGQSEEIIQKVEQIKNERIESLTNQWKETQKKYETEEQKIYEIKRLIEFSQPEDEENISELIDFVGKMSGIVNQVQELKSFLIEIDFDQNQNQVFESLQNFAKFQIAVKEISLELQVLKLQEPQQLEIDQEFQHIRTIQRNSKNKKTYSTINGQFTNEEQNIQTTEDHNTQIEQFQEDGLIISGAFNTNQNRFILNLQNQTQQFQMKNDRRLHRTNYDRKASIVYIISGEFNTYVQECEVFKMSTQSFETINPIETPVYAFGSGLMDYFDLYTFGGRSSNGDVDQIQVYQSQTNSWQTCQQSLLSKAKTTAIFLQNQKVFLIYSNCSRYLDTQTFDIRQITRHGQKFNGQANYVFTQPVLNQNFVYQFDYQTDLFRYDFANGNWNKV